MLTETVETQISRALRAAAGRDAVTDLYFVACGGSYALMLANAYAVDRESAAIAGFAVNAAEFKARAPRRLGPGSVVILCSHSGTTPETVEAAEIARAAGALTIALTIAPESPLAKAAHHTVVYTHAPMTMTADHSPAVLYRLTFGILAARESNAKLADLDAGLAVLPALVDAQIAAQKGAIAAFAESHKREPVIYTMGSGASYGVAYSFAIASCRKCSGCIRPASMRASISTVPSRSRTSTCRSSSWWVPARRGRWTSARWPSRRSTAAA